MDKSYSNDFSAELELQAAKYHEGKAGVVGKCLREGRKGLGQFADAEVSEALLGLSEIFFWFLVDLLMSLLDNHPCYHLHWDPMI